MEFHVQQVLDYMKCPMLYRFRWVDKADSAFTPHGGINNLHIKEEYDKALHHSAYGLYHYITNGEYPTLYQLKKRWGKMWSKGRPKEDVLLQQFNWRNEHKILEQSGLRVLSNLHEKLKDAPGVPILIGKGYTIKIGEHVLHGVLELVREVKQDDKSFIELVDFRTDKRQHAAHIRGDLAVTAASMAFRNLFGYKEERIAFYGLLSNKLLYTTRTEQDYQNLALILDNVAKGIEGEIYYPVFNERCNECPFVSHCAQKHWQEEL